MCFSASASFAAGAVLTVIGVASITKAHQSSQLLFASIPLIFGVQQLAEGVLWRTLSNPDYINTQQVFTYIFLFFAQVIWPLCVPIAILLLEKKGTRKNIQKLFVGVGLIVVGYLAYCLLMYNVEAKIVGLHIVYLQDYPSYFSNYVIILYALATIAPFFFSHVKRMWMLGMLVLVSYIVTLIFYDQYVISVWCFFSSIISLSIYAIMMRNSKNKLAKRNFQFI